MTESETREEKWIEEAKEYLSEYRMCEDMLRLRKYERKRLVQEEFSNNEELLAGSEAFWRFRMEEIRNLLTGMRNGREKLLLYYRYIRGESVEHASNLLGVSRRTGYRMHRRGLLSVGALLQRMKK